MSYASTPLPSSVPDKFYALDNGCGRGRIPIGPWEVAMEVPEEIYTIPKSPVYYARSHVSSNHADEVEVGYTLVIRALRRSGTVV